jgi:hypothetical protein
MAEQLSDVDRDALDRCMTIAMRDKLSAEQLNSKLDDGEPWADVAASASYGVQGERAAPEAVAGTAVHHGRGRSKPRRRPGAATAMPNARGRPVPL